MADNAVARTALTANVQGADLRTAAANIESIAAGDTAVCNVAGNTSNIIWTLYSASGSTYTVSVGDNPPSLVNTDNIATQTIAAGAIVPLVVKGGQVMQDNGTVRINNTGANAIILACLVLPRESGAG